MGICAIDLKIVGRPPNQTKTERGFFFFFWNRNSPAGGGRGGVSQKRAQVKNGVLPLRKPSLPKAWRAGVIISRPH